MLKYASNKIIYSVIHLPENTFFDPIAGRENIPAVPENFA
jgi:hypothetical protein